MASGHVRYQTAGTCTLSTTPVSSDYHNQLGGTFTYDASSDLTYDGTNTLTYDAEGRIATSTASGSTTTYIYGADGQRIGKTKGGVETNYARGIDGSLLATYVCGTFNGYPQEMWVDGKHFGTVTVGTNGTQTSNFSLTNWLGSEVAHTNSVTGVPCAAYLSQPYGDSQTALFDCDTDDIHFTGKERDTESGNDYFGARYYASNMGRWMSPDPLNLTNARLMNPSNTMNKYAYAANNPLKYLDKDGKDITIFYRAPENIIDTGHIFIGAVNTENGSAAFLNFHPLPGSELYGPGTFQNNLQSLGANGINNGYASLTIQTNPGPETKKIVDLINQINAGTAPNFFLYGNNCTTVCEDALHDVGLDFGDLSPQSFWDHAFVKFSPDMKTNPFKAFFPPSAPGHDYGNPRNFGGVNYSTLLYNLVFPQQDNTSVTTSQGDGVPCGGNTGNPCFK